VFTHAVVEQVQLLPARSGWTFSLSKSFQRCTHDTSFHPQNQGKSLKVLFLLLERSSSFSRDFMLAMLERSSYNALTMEKNKAAQMLGRLGGLKGGKARAAKLTAEERSLIAKKAAESRWSKKPEDEPDQEVNQQWNSRK
jgi:hypothetical protein